MLPTSSALRRYRRYVLSNRTAKKAETAVRACFKYRAENKAIAREVLADECAYFMNSVCMTLLARLLLRMRLVTVD